MDEGHLDRRGAEEERHEAVDDEFRLSHQHLVAGLQENVADQLDHLVRAVADHELVGRKVEEAGQPLSQRVAAPVRIVLALLDRSLARLNRLWRRAERVLVRSELDDARRVEAEVARHVLDRPARNIGRVGLDGGL